jgi:hypothetical protein
MEEIRIRIKGQVDSNWSKWLGGLTLTHAPEGETLITGTVRDESTLYGLINKLASLGIHLVSVSCSTMVSNTEGGIEKYDEHNTSNPVGQK